MAVIVNLASFTGTAGQELTAADSGWTRNTSAGLGSANITVDGAGVALGPTGSSLSAAYLRTETPGSRNQVVRSTMAHRVSTVDIMHVLLARCDGSNWVGAYFLRNTPAVFLVKRVSGTRTTITSQAITVDLNTPYEVELSVTGTAPNILCTVKVDGVTQITHTITDAALDLVGNVGIATRAFSSVPGGGEQQFFDFYAEDDTGGGGTAVSFTGTVPTQNLTQDSAMSALDLSTYFSGTETPFSYAVQSGTLPAGLSLNSSTGVISGTPTATGTASIVVRATDDNSDTADTNSFDIVVASAATAISFTGTVPTQNLTEDVAMTSLDLTSYFSGSETPFTYAIQSGTLPTGLSLSSGVISGTPTQVGTFPIVVRGTDDATNTADTNSFNIVVASAVATVTVTDPLKNNTGTLWASETGIKASVLNATTLESVYEVTGLTTNGSGVLEAISNAALNAGDRYHVAIKLSDGSVGITGPITAT